MHVLLQASASSHAAVSKATKLPQHTNTTDSIRCPGLHNHGLPNKQHALSQLHVTNKLLSTHITSPLQLTALFLRPTIAMISSAPNYISNTASAAMR
jgi:hypothetical protein